MKLSSIITTAAQLGLVMSTAIPAITTPEENSIALREAELIGAQDANGIDKREVFTWDKIPVATACWACLVAQGASIGLQLKYVRDSIPWWLSTPFTAAASVCMPTNLSLKLNPCGTQVTGTDWNGQLHTMTEAEWIGYVGSGQLRQ